MDLVPLLRKGVAGLSRPPYPPLDPSRLRMDANTNLLGPNPAVARALAAGAEGTNHYPSPLNDELRAAVAAAHGLDAAEIVIGDGSDELIDLLFKTFCNPDDVVAAPVPTFVMYRFFADVNGAKFDGVPLGPDWSLDVDALLARRAKLAFVASPNNPTGNAHPADVLERILRETTRGIVVVDEAYAEYAGQHWIRRVREFPNLVVLRTFSKAYGLAGLRVGAMAARREIVERILAVKAPFTVSCLSERAALEALRDRSYLDASLAMVASERPWLQAKLLELGLRVHPSDANFLLADVGCPAKPLAESLASAGVLVRALPDVPTCLRITVGRREDNERLVAALERHA